MPEKSITERLTTVIVDQLGIKPEKVKPESKFIEDLGADSLDTVELIMACEDEFDLEVSDEDAEKIVTVGNAIEYLEGKLK